MDNLMFSALALFSLSLSSSGVAASKPAYECLFYGDSSVGGTKGSFQFHGDQGKLSLKVSHLQLDGTLSTSDGSFQFTLTDLSTGVSKSQFYAYVGKGNVGYSTEVDGVYYTVTCVSAATGSGAN